MTISEKLNAAFPFTVDKFRLQGPDNLTTPFFGLFRSDNSQCVPVAVTKQFVPHTTEDVIALAEAARTAFDLPDDQLKVAAAWTRTGHRVSIRPTEAYRQSIFGEKDNIWPSLVIRAGYGKAFTTSCGLYRDACRNMSIVRGVEKTTTTIAHRGNFRQEFDSLVHSFQSLAAKFDNIVEVARAYEAKKVAIADFLAAMYPVPGAEATASTVTRHRTKMQALLNRFTDERLKTGRENPHNYSGEASVWEMLNIVTGYEQWDSQVRGKLTDTDRMFRAVDSTECDRAWELAAEMAA